MLYRLGLNEHTPQTAVLKEYTTHGPVLNEYIRSSSSRCFQRVHTSSCCFERVHTSSRCFERVHTSSGCFKRVHTSSRCFVVSLDFGRVKSTVNATTKHHYTDFITKHRAPAYPPGHKNAKTCTAALTVDVAVCRRAFVILWKERAGFTAWPHTEIVLNIRITN